MCVREFRYTLAARATRRTEHGCDCIHRTCHHGDPPDLLASRYPHGADGACFSTAAHGIGCILDIATNMYRA
jgi:hypothetical protein